MASRTELVQQLRDQIVGAIHLGQLRAGDRLPSIREVARRVAGNARTVRAAYDALQREGLVAVRGRSGVFVAPQEIGDAGASRELARWLGCVVAEAWSRRIAVAALPRTVERFTASRRVRCGLVDLIEDGIVALSWELEHEFGFGVRVVAPDAIEDAAGEVDFFAATGFYAAGIRAAVERVAKPLLVLTVHPGLKEAVQRQVRSSGLTLVASDPRFADRMRVTYCPDDPSRIRFVAATDRHAVAQLDPDEPVMLTRAARQVTGPIRAPLVFPHSPTISPESARALAALLVQRNMEVLDAVVAE